MLFLLYSLSLFFFLVGTAVYLSRARWLPTYHEAIMRVRAFRISFPGQSFLYARLPSTFLGDAEAGLSSSTFDLTGNVETGDSRAGLDDAAKREILTIMKKRRMLFDDARRFYMEQRFAANGIGADGRPRDPKLVSFS